MPKQKIDQILENLADWLLEDSVSFRQLDSYRRKLKMDSDQFADLLGIHPVTYSKYRRTKEVKLGTNREKMHEMVLGYQCATRASQNTRFKLEFEGLEKVKTTLRDPRLDRPANDGWKLEEIKPNHFKVCRVFDGSVPTALVPGPKPNAKLIKQSKEMAVSRIRAKHAPQPGDDYDQCECSICMED